MSVVDISLIIYLPRKKRFVGIIGLKRGLFTRDLILTLEQPCFNSTNIVCTDLMAASKSILLCTFRGVFQFFVLQFNFRMICFVFNLISAAVPHFIFHRSYWSLIPCWISNISLLKNMLKGEFIALSSSSAKAFLLAYKTYYLLSLV